jgi:L,D-transpeptidase YcbB
MATVAQRLRDRTHRPGLAFCAALLLTAALSAPVSAATANAAAREAFARALEGAFDAQASAPHAGSAAVAADLTAELKRRVDRASEADLYDFYAARAWSPLWIGKTVRPEAQSLIAQIGTAAADGLDPSVYRLDQLSRVVEAAETGGPSARAEAELALSRALAAYVLDLRRGKGVTLAFVDPGLKAPPATVRAALDAAAAAPSLEAHLRSLPALNPVYVALREQLSAFRAGGVTAVAAKGGSADRERLLRVNLERARALPPVNGRRYIIVNTAAARLWLIEDGKVVDTMKVVVGKREQPTPMMAGLVRYAIYNPYWNVPEDLTRTSIAAKVLKQGLPYLKTEGMEVLADWSDGAERLDPETLDWRAIASGSRVVRVRQLPGERNMMGAVKLMLPNPLGVYLHDTPNKAAFDLQERLLSSGCVRLEDALRLASRLVPDPPAGLGRTDGERQVNLPEPVPVYITYLTLAPEDGVLVSHPDIYQRDGALLATLDKAAKPIALAARDQ